MRETHSKIASTTGSISGAASILGSWQICHNVCLALIALLSVLGITVTGMPLAFFTKIALPLWILAVVMLGVVVYFYNTKKCISKYLLIMNTGLIITGIPFKALQGAQKIFWIVGGITALYGLTFFIKEKISTKKCKRCEYE